MEKTPDYGTTKAGVRITDPVLAELLGRPAKRTPAPAQHAPTPDERRRDYLAAKGSSIELNGDAARMRADLHALVDLLSDRDIHELWPGLRRILSDRQ